MAIQITSRKIFDKLRPSESVDWSLFCVGEPIRIEIEFTVYTLITFTGNSPMLIDFGGAIAPNTITTFGNRFAGINVGDTIKITDPGVSVGPWFDYLALGNLSYTVLFKNSANEIIVSNSIENDSPLPTVLSSTARIENLTPITGVGMPYNFIENNEALNFNSKVDGTYQRLYADNCDASDTTPIPMLFDNGLPYQIGSATIEGAGWDTVNGEQKFKIVHETVVTPIILAQQYTDFQAGVAPSYFLNNRCLRHVYQIQAFAVLTNPNSAQIGDCPNEIGNSGWFDEVFNGGLKNVNITDLTPINTDFDVVATEQTINLRISSSEIPITASTKLVFGAVKFPNTQTEYQNNLRDFVKNFLFAEASGDTTTSPLTPTNTGTDLQTISNIDLVFDTDHIDVEIKLELGVDAISILNESVNPRMLIYVIVSNDETNPALSEKQCLIAREIEFSNTRNLNPRTERKYLRHYEGIDDSGIETTPQIFIEDECVMVTDFYESTRGGAQTFYKGVKSKIVAKKLDGTEFVLESLEWATTTPLGYDSAQIINFEQPRVFNIPSSEPRKTYSIKNIPSEVGRYRIIHPFMIRWEYWLQLLSANLEFYNPSLPNNGLNQLWLNYIVGDWKLYHRTVLIGEAISAVPIVLNEYVEDTELEMYGYESNPAYTTKDVESYRVNNSSLFDSGNSRWYYLQNEPTKIRAIFEKAVSFDLPNTYVVFGIEIFEQGGIGGRRRFSSKWATDTPLTWFIPLSGANKVQLTNVVGDTIVAEALLSPDQIPQGEFVFKIVARIYEADAAENNKITEDGIDKITEEDSEIKIIE